MSAQEPGRRWPPLLAVLAVAAGGALGGSLRHALLTAFPADPAAFPWLIFVHNTVGAGLLGLVLTLLPLPGSGRSWLRPFLTTGMLGAFTTFSNFSLDVVTLSGQGQVGWALLYSAASIGTGLAACGVGILLGRGWARCRAP